jgi:hypothetical protein
MRDEEFWRHGRHDADLPGWRRRGDDEEGRQRGEEEGRCPRGRGDTAFRMQRTRCAGQDSIVHHHFSGSLILADRHRGGLQESPFRRP